MSAYGGKADIECFVLRVSVPVPTAMYEVNRPARSVRSCQLEIGLPGLDGDPDRRIGILAPQFAAIEAHGVKPLWTLASVDRVAIRKDVAPNNAHHLA